MLLLKNMVNLEIGAMYKYIIATSLLGLSACGGGGLVMADDPNKASISTEMINGALVVSGFAGSNFDDGEIENLIVAPECAAAGMSVAELSISPASGGSNVRAVCG